MERLRVAAMRVFAERGYHAARVDDIVRAARTSHGTFYLYFSNKEELLRELAVACADAIEALACDIGPVTCDAAGIAELERFLGRFLSTYADFGPVIRAWMEDHVADREVNRLGVHAFTAIASSFAGRIGEVGGDASPARVGALMALLERFAYYVSSGRVDGTDPVVLSTLALTVHRGFFVAAAPLVGTRH